MEWSVDSVKFASPDHKIWNDTSSSWGAGAFWKSEWFQLQWSAPLLHQQIVIKELIPFVLVLAQREPTVTTKQLSQLITQAIHVNHSSATYLDASFSSQEGIMHPISYPQFQWQTSKQKSTPRLHQQPSAGEARLDTWTHWFHSTFIQH